MKFIIGKKISMTQIWRGDNLLGVTEVQAGPCTITQVKTIEKDGYKAVQIGCDVAKEKNTAKPQKGHLAGLTNHRFLKEFRLEAKENTDLKRGDIIDVTTFSAGDNIKVIGTSKGKGFQGVVKRYGFHGQDSTHGHKDQERMSGSIGAGGVQHVFKGTKMSGRTGGERVTVANLEIVEVNMEKNTIYIKGAIPGHRNSLVLIYGPGELKLAENKEKEKVMEKTEDTSVEENVAPANEEQPTEESVSEEAESTENSEENK